MALPLISIVIANYNYGRFLEDAIQSVIEQNMGDKIELIICDAASNDNSVEVIKKYEKHISWWCSEKDKGQSDAFNKGFAHSTGRFLTWLNADDVLIPGALKVFEDICEKNPACEWFSGSSLYVDKELRIIKWFRCHRFSWLRAKYGYLMCGGPSSFFTKRVLDAVGGVDVGLHFLMDIDLWYKFVRKLGLRYVRMTDAIFAYRIHESSKMSGADVAQTDKNASNRVKAKIEFDLIKQRYNLPSTWIRRLATVLSFSIIDKIVSIFITISRKGKKVQYE